MTLLSRGAAMISADGSYRYALARHWGTGPRVLFIMLNPSTADAETDDPTIRRCVGFARAWGFGGLWVGNLFAFRSTEPQALRRCGDAVGSDNDAAIAWMAEDASLVVGAWGNGFGDTSALRRREKIVSAMLCERVTCLGTTREGRPRHPLYLSGRTVPEPWAPVA